MMELGYFWKKKSNIKRLSAELQHFLKYEPKNIVLKTFVLENVAKMMLYVFDHFFNNEKHSELPISDTVGAENRDTKCTIQRGLRICFILDQPLPEPILFARWLQFYNYCMLPHLEYDQNALSWTGRCCSDHYAPFLHSKSLTKMWNRILTITVQPNIHGEYFHAMCLRVILAFHQIQVQLARIEHCCIHSTKDGEVYPIIWKGHYSNSRTPPSPRH